MYEERTQNNSLIQNSGGAKDPKGSQFTATTETDAGRKYVESVQKVSKPL
jgi:hypothetical protein